MQRDGIAAIAVCATLAAPLLARAETPQERGAYLVKSIAACGNCHTDSAPGAAELAGGMRFSELAYTARAANLTPDPENGVAGWTDDQLVRGLRDGKRPKGSTIGPPMPVTTYRSMSDDDARAIVAYLRSIPPRPNHVPHSTYRLPLPESWGPEVTTVAAPPDNDPVAYGRYLASGLGQCMDCHSRRGENGLPDFVNGLAAGGAELRGPWGVSLAPNITPNGIGYYSDDELRKVITTGVRPDGSKLNPPMPVAYYANMTAKDLSAIIAFLRSLPKK